MRRVSDSRQGVRTGHGRRARDRLLTGASVDERLRGPHAADGALFLADDLREAALALAGVEAFVVRAESALADGMPSPAVLAALAQDRTVSTQLELLADALTSLRRAMGALAG